MHSRFDFTPTAVDHLFENAFPAKDCILRIRCDDHRVISNTTRVVAPIFPNFFTHASVEFFDDDGAVLWSDGMYCREVPWTNKKDCNGFRRRFWGISILAPLIKVEPSDDDYEDH